MHHPPPSGKKIGLELNHMTLPRQRASQRFDIFGRALDSCRAVEAFMNKVLLRPTSLGLGGRDNGPAK
jgi:hypothetical protein